MQKIDAKKLEKQMQLNFLNAAKLAEATKITPSSISKLKLGKTSPRAGTMQKLCDVLNCTPADLLED